MIRKKPPALRTPPPLELRATRFEDGGNKLVVLSYPLDVAEPTDAFAAVLTPAQREIAALVLAGYSNRAIAKRRGTAIGTVAKQLEQMYRRLGINSRRELVALAARARSRRHTAG